MSQPYAKIGNSRVAGYPQLGGAYGNLDWTANVLPRAICGYDVRKNEIAAPLFVEAAISRAKNTWGLAKPLQRWPPGYPILPCNTARGQFSPILP